MRRSLIALALSACLLPLLAVPASACPSCSEAVPSTSNVTDDDQTREALAYNQSIYLMAGMPYLLLSIVGVVLYRVMRRKAVADQAIADAVEVPGSPPTDAEVLTAR